jgi:hypothetical protein
MRNMRTTNRCGFLLVAVLTALAGSCKIEGKRKPHETIGPEAETLRAAFNANVGKVRLVVLVAPT